MRKILLLVILVTVLISKMNAVPANPHPIKYTQPDGSVITVQLKGDERVHWAESSDGYTLLSNGKNGWEYAVTDDAGDLKVSGVLAREVNKRTAGELKLLQRVEKRNRFSQKQIDMLKSGWEAKNGSDKLIGTSDYLKPNAVKSSNNDGRRKVFTPLGVKKLLMILIEYKDVKFTKTQSDFAGLMNTPGYMGNGAHGSVRDYFHEASYGQFDLTTTVAPHVYLAKENMAYYGTDVDGNHSPKAAELMAEAVLAAAADGVDFSQYDNDGDGSVDGVYVVFAGYSQATGGPMEAIWAHAGAISPALTCDGKTVSKYSCSNELTGGSGTNITTIGVICHEFGHVCGAPDYYDTNYSTDGDFNGTGYWDVMDVGLYNGSPSGSLPAHFNPFEKTRAGWVTPTLLTNATSFTIPDITTNPAVYQYNTTTADEYFLMENRQRTGFNADIPGSGLMIYHYSKSIWDVSGNKTAPQGFYPVCASSTTNPTTSSDATSYGNISTASCPFPGSSAKRSFADETTPSAKSWAGNNSFKPITGITEDNTAKTISLTFMGGNSCTPPTIQATNFTATNIRENELTLNWTRGNGDKVIVLARRKSAVNTTPLNGITLNASSIFQQGDLVDPDTYVIYNGTGTNVTFTDLLKNSTYYFAVFEYNSELCYTSTALSGSASTLGCSPCVPTATTKGSTTGITNVSFNTINNSSDYSTTAYTSYAEIRTNVTPGTTYTLSVSTHSYTNTVYTKAWIDWNNDCVFQSSEEYDLGSSTNDAVVTKQIQVPLNVYSGDVTMRIRTRYNTAPTSCDNNNFSEAEDYTLKIVGGCTPPTTQSTNFSATGIQNGQATINWVRGNGENVMVIAHQGAAVDSYPIGVLDFTANAQFGLGAQIGTGNYVVYNGTGNNVTVTGLLPGINYYFAVYEYNSTNCILMSALTGSVTITDETIWTGGTSSDWFATSNWSTGVLPTATTSITIPSGTTYSPVIAASGAVCNNITINNGATVTMGTTATNDLTISGNLTNNGTLSSTTTNSTINIGGNWTNNGTFDYGTSSAGSKVNFNGTNSLQTINGTATTDFYVLQVKKGSISNILEVTAPITLKATSGNLVLTSGMLKISSNSTITPLTSTTLSINSSSGIWNNGGTINPTGKQCNLTGILKSSAGISNFSYLLPIGSINNVQIDGGTVNISQYIEPYAPASDIVNYSQTGGTFNVSSANASIPFMLNAGSTFNMSGGTISIQKASTATADYQNLAATSNVTGGTLQIGNGSTAAGQTIRISSTVPVYNLAVNSHNSPTAKLLADLTVKGDVTIGSGTQIDANSLNLTVGGNWLNNGGALTTPLTGTVTLNGATAQSIAGSSNTTFNNLTIDNTTGVTANSTLTTVAGNLVINDGKLLNVAPAKALTVNGTFTNNAGNTGFVLQSDATGTGTFLDNGTANAAVGATVQQYLPSVRNWYMSSPVTGATTPAGNTYYKYVENANNGATWSPISSGSTFDVMTGYIVKPAAATTFAFSGALNTGAQSITGLTSTATAKTGFNLVGNPYPSYVNWMSAAKTNLSTTIWYRTQNSATTPAYVFDTYNETANTGTNNNGVAAVTGMIPPMQAFWVKVNAGSPGSLAFDNSMRSHQDVSTNKFRAPAANAAQQVLRLQVFNGTNSDEAIVLFNANAADGYDAYDSQKMTNANNSIPEIYTFVGTDKLVINGLNSITTNSLVPLGFSTSAANSFSIKASEVSNFDADTKIVLKDNMLKVEQDITDGTPYSFTSDVASMDNRFSVVFKSKSSTTGIYNSTEKETIIVSKNANNQIVVISNTNYQTGVVTVSNTIGQKLHSATITGITTVITKSFNPGVYLVTVDEEEKHVTKKVIIN